MIDRARIDREPDLENVPDPRARAAGVTGIAQVPLLWLGGRGGGEVEHALALVVVGGRRRVVPRVGIDGSREAR